MTLEVITRFLVIAGGYLLLWRAVSTPLMGVPRLWRLIRGGLNAGPGEQSPRCQISERNRVSKRFPPRSLAGTLIEFRSPIAAGTFKTPTGGSPGTNAGSPLRRAPRGFSTRMRPPRPRRASARITSSEVMGIFRITWPTRSLLTPN